MFCQKKILNDHLLAQSGLSKKLDENSILKKLFYRENITVALEFLHRSGVKFHYGSGPEIDLWGRNFEELFLHV